MTSITDLAKEMQQIFTQRANQLAYTTTFMNRERVLTGSSFIVGLVSGWQADPDSSLAGLSQAVGNAGTPISRQGLNQRFDAGAVRFMRAMVDECLGAMVTGLPVEQALLRRFSAVELTDSSIITLPNSLASVYRASGGYGEQASQAALKLSLRWNMVNGDLTHMTVHDAITHDRACAAHTAPCRPGSLQIRDLGYYKLDDLARIDQEGAYWLMKYKGGTILLDSDRQPIDLDAWLPEVVNQRLDTTVYVGKRKQLPARLVCERVPQAVVDQRHERIRETARQNQRPPSARALNLAHWTIYLTNTPVALLATREVFVMARYRWQIELLFKMWKSDLHLDQWRTSNPHRLLCELYGKLIVAIVTHWFLLVSVWASPDRSLRQVLPTIRGLAWQWANSLHCLELLLHTLRSLCRAVSRSRLETSRRYPRTYQLMAGSPCLT